MTSILNTANAKTRDQALDIITKQMTNSTLYIPLAYKLDESGCSCCRSESFDLICKVGDEYKILGYDGYIKHKNDCARIRCSCDAPFTWKNINPKEQKYDGSFDIAVTFTSIKDNTWFEECNHYFEQQQENTNIYKYNEDDEIEYLKNYDFYFR
jgi:hypothetical protein